MNWLIDNWIVVVGILALTIAAGWAVYVFFGLPTGTQLAKIKEWLLWAVVLAETELGSGTGEIKLRYVYDMFVGRFPTVAKIVSFETFAKWVDEALDEMKVLLGQNKVIAEFVAPIEVK